MSLEDMITARVAEQIVPYEARIILLETNNKLLESRIKQSDLILSELTHNLSTLQLAIMVLQGNQLKELGEV